jgi:hypothetical protein
MSAKSRSRTLQVVHLALANTETRRRTAQADRWRVAGPADKPAAIEWMRG